MQSKRFCQVVYFALPVYIVVDGTRDRCYTRDYVAITVSERSHGYDPFADASVIGRELTSEQLDRLIDNEERRQLLFQEIDMASSAFQRHIPFEGIINFRDLGGYRTQDGRSVKWGTIFRSSELQHMTENDVIHLKEELGLTTVLDLRSAEELESRGIGPLQGSVVSHQHVPFSGSASEMRERIRRATYMGEVYLLLLEQPGFGDRVVDALELIGDADRHPTVFHCTAGKDRTGMLAGLLLGILGVADEDIVRDYTLSDEPMKHLESRILADPQRVERFKELPQYTHRAVSKSMTLFLSTLRREYGSVTGYVEAQGGNANLFQRLRDVLLD